LSATALGALVLGERLTSHQVAGALVIASALAVVDGRLVRWLARMTGQIRQQPR
jgi:drug/metabolite transporter (DMT)-like permease